MDLPATALDQQHCSSPDQSHMSESNAETFTRSDKPCNRPTLVNFHSSSTDSGFDDDEITKQDSPTEIIASKTDRVRGPSFSSFKTIASRSSSVFSVISGKPQNETADKVGEVRYLPTVFENVSPPQNQQVVLYSPNMVWQAIGVLKNTWGWGAVSNLGKRVRRVYEWGTRRRQQTGASPEMDPSVNTTNGSRHLQTLLIEAMLILTEAEVEGFNPTEESSTYL